jgi:uncharacterized membrane protein
MELTKENKKWILIIGGAIVVLFVVGLMLKFWIYTIVAIACFGAGFIYGRRSVKKKDKIIEDGKGIF